MRIREAYVRRHASRRSFERGREYWNNRAVTIISNHSHRIEGEVEGSDWAPYRVEVELDESGDPMAACDCPYDSEGWCKHVVAVLLAVAAERKAGAQEGDSIPDQLASLVDFEREALIAEAFREVPEFATFVQRWFSKTLPDGSGEASRRDMLALARTRDLSAGNAFDGNLEKLFDRALSALDCDRVAQAMATLEKVTSAAAREYETLDDSDGEFAEFVRSLGRAWIDAAIMLDGDARKSKPLARRVAGWKDGFDEYGVGDEMGVATLVLERSVTEAATLLPHADLLSELQRAHLRVLARRGQVERYLSLALTIGENTSYLAMLLCAGEYERAAREALNLVKEPQEALRFGRLLERERPVDALKVGERGLAMRGEGYDELACWVRDLALERGDKVLALEAAEAAVRDWPTRDDYRVLKSIAAAGWKQVRARILEAVRASLNTEEVIRILLEEGLVAEAIQRLERPNVLVSYDLLDTIVQAAIHGDPEWAARTARDQAERIMNAGKSEYYHHASRWLGRARAACQASNRGDEWQVYRTSLLLRHKRKYKLVAIIESL